ncbi:MAG: hypothetical protein ACREPQ_01285 [Rhodanobacter sp.]
MCLPSATGRARPTKLPKIDPKELAQNVVAYATFSYMVAQADGDFGSAPGEHSPAAAPTNDRYCHLSSR